VLPPRVYRALRRRRVGVLIERFEPRVVTHRYGSVELRLLLADPLAERWYDLDWPPLPELAILRDHGLRPGARVFDIGAHQGLIALVLAHEVGPEGEVVAVEPSAHNIGVAERNRELNGAQTITFVRAAVSDGSAATVAFMDDLNGYVVPEGGSGLEEATAVTIDELAARYGAPDVVAVDVEGYEERALAGASATLAAGRASFYVEVHAGCGLERAGGSVRGVLSAFDRERYALLVAPVIGARTHVFVALEDDAAAAITRSHFFAIAIPRGSD
jgi:FkbM family methyltransferase